MRRSVLILVFWLATLAWPQPALSATWTRLSSEHFVFVGDVAERDLRARAQRLELFREAIARLFPARIAESPVPTVVLVFKDDRAFMPFRPTFAGKPLSVAGYSTGSEDVNYLAVNASQAPHADAIIFHEYAHQFLRERVGELPLWLNEGLAEFFATFKPAADGRRAVLGLANDDNLSLLKTSPGGLSFGQLASVHRDSPTYNDDERRNLFYARAWALVHYLLLGGEAPARQLQQLLAETFSGVPADVAWTTTFGSTHEALEDAVTRHIRGPALQATTLTFEDAQWARPISRPETLAAADAAAYLGDVLAHLGRTADARVFLRAAVNAPGATARAVAALGLLEVRDGQLDAGWPLLERAVRLAPDMAAAQRWYARALLQRVTRGDAPADALRSRARSAIDQALELEPSYEPAIASWVRQELPVDPANAMALLAPLLTRAPAREDYRLLLGEALIAQRDFHAASVCLGPLLAQSSHAGIRDAARSLLARMSRSASAAGADPE